MFVPFFDCKGAKPNCPDTAVRAVDGAIADHLKKLGKGAPSRPSHERSVRGTLEALLHFQGIVVKGLESQAWKDVIEGLTSAADSATAAMDGMSATPTGSAPGNPTAARPVLGSFEC